MRAVICGIAIALSSACSVIVQPSDDRVRCQVSAGVDPCPAGQRCLDGVCTTVPDAGSECMEQETGCNDLDDDCDGTIDEGSDVDADGFEWCASEPRLRDCRDDDPAIHPDGPDRPAPDDVPCDGADNDCSGGASECPAGQVCHPEGGCRPPDCSFATVCPAMYRCNTDLVPPTCEMVTEDCTLSGCASAPGTVCDPVSRACILPRRLGEPCAFDDQCEAGALCYDALALAVDPSEIGGASRVCSKPCCANSQCPDDTLCWAPGTGARGCLPTTLVTPAPSDQPCGRDGQCVAGGDCSLHDSPADGRTSRYAMTCGSSGGFTDGWCLSNGDCYSGICFRNHCSAACGGSPECGSEYYCGYLRLESDVVQVCIWDAGFSSGGAAQGATCASPDDCRGTSCVASDSGGSSYCADACCNDDDCGGAFACRPRRFDGFWAMLCQER